MGCPTGCKEPNECFIDIHLALIGDDEKINKFGTKYIRDGEPHCCGKKLETINSPSYFQFMYCTVCANEY